MNDTAECTVRETESMERLEKNAVQAIMLQHDTRQNVVRYKQKG